MKHYNPYYIYAASDILNHSILSYYQTLMLAKQFSGINNRLHPVGWVHGTYGIFSLN